MDVATVSAKGQVVIPLAVRRALGISAGTRFAVAGSEDSVIFKKIDVPTAKQLFEELGKTARAFAKARGLKEKDVVKIIHRGRGIKE